MNKLWRNDRSLFAEPTSHESRKRPPAGPLGGAEDHEGNYLSPGETARPGLCGWASGNRCSYRKRRVTTVTQPNSTEELRTSVRRRILYAKAWFRKQHANAAYHMFAIRSRYARWLAQYRTSLVTALLAGLMAVSLWFEGQVQSGLEPFFPTEQRLSDLRAVLVQVGGALVGAAAIVSSLVLFSMQVNIERMPHGLFRRLGSDRSLMTAFAGAFFLAIAVLSLSLLTDKSRLGIVVFRNVSTTLRHRLRGV